jgi:DNA-binding transcriptional ArsR family regulator
MSRPRLEPAAKRDPVVLTNPRAIKALAHPARLAAIDELFNGRKLTATECAEIVGLSASAMSYHLRALEKWGIIRRSESTEDGRERPWEAAGGSLRLESSEPRASLTGESVLINRLFDRQRTEALNWVGRDHAAGEDWDDVMTIASRGCWLTIDEARRLRTDLQDVLDRYQRQKPTDLPDETKKIRITLSLVPTLADGLIPVRVPDDAAPDDAAPDDAAPDDAAPEIGVPRRP